MRILGLNPGPHDAAAALVVDGRLLSFLEEERLSRNKRSPGVAPLQAARACLDYAGLGLADVNIVAIGWDVGLDRHPGDADYEQGIRDWLIPEELFGEGARSISLVSVPHHLAHAASAYFTTTWDEALVVVIDGRGESESTSIFYGQGETLSLLRSYDIGNSLGHFYETAAWWAGLTTDEPGKLMGLAPYGRPRFSLPLRVTDSSLFEFGPFDEPDGEKVQLRQQEELLSCFSELYPFSRGDKRDIMAYADFAASVQAALEEAVLELCSTWVAELGCGRVAMTGGVASNCTLNGKLLQAAEIDELRVSPVPYDAGTALGAALWAGRQRAADLPRTVLDHPFWQPVPDSAAESVRLLQGSGCTVMSSPDEYALAAHVARRLEAGGVVALWQERGEIGQRALGGRSLLCDPRNRSALVRINELKGREMWRPVAPSVQAEYWDSLFAIPAQPPASFMLAAYPVRVGAQRLIPACVHIDGSARPQAVSRSRQPALLADHRSVPTADRRSRGREHIVQPGRRAHRLHHGRCGRHLSQVTDRHTGGRGDGSGEAILVTAPASTSSTSGGLAFARKADHQSPPPAATVLLSVPSGAGDLLWLMAFPEQGDRPEYDRSGSAHHAGH